MVFGGWLYFGIDDVGVWEFFDEVYVCEQDYYKSLMPSQLLAERGEEIVVINPGMIMRCTY